MHVAVHEGEHVSSATAARSHTASTSALPGLFVVGAAKSGTTALYQYFKLHPEVFVPASLKETNFMAFCGGLPPLAGPGDTSAIGNSITTLADYQNLYQGRTTELSAADCSPAYLYYPQAPLRIAQLAPQAKIVMILRNPIECVCSMYSMMRRERREPCRSLLAAFERSEERMAAGWEWAWDYKQCFRFSAQVKRYLDAFPASQLFIRRYEQLQHDPETFYRDLTRFAGIPQIDIALANQRVNTAPRRIDMIRKRKIGRLLCQAGRIASTIVPASITTQLQRRLENPVYTLTPHDRRVLIDHFGADILELSRILSWDLSDWVRV